MDRSMPRWILASCGMAIALVLAGSVWAYRIQEQRLRESAEESLLAIGRLKVAQIADWRSDFLADVAVSVGNPFVASFERWFASPSESSDPMLAFFRLLKEQYHYSDVFLVDPTGRIRLAAEGAVDRLHPEVLSALPEALRARRPILSDLDANASLAPHVAVTTPLFASGGDTATPLGALVVVIYARQFLYPLLQSWPTPSPSAETLLVRRDGDNVLFLNDLRHRDGAAFTLRLPLSAVELPAAHAVLGQRGVMRGIDYRGVDVLAALFRVPDSPWFLVAKIDADEVFAPWRSLSTLIVALIATLVALLASLGVALWWHSRKSHYRSLLLARTAELEAEEAHRRTEEALRNEERVWQRTFDANHDAICVLDAEQRIVRSNRAMNELTGKTEPDLIGRHCYEVVHGTTEPVLECPIRPMRGSRRREQMEFHAGDRWLEVTVDPMLDEQSGALLGAVHIVRDVTQRKLAQQALADEAVRRRILVDQSRDGIVVLDEDGKVYEANQRYADMLGYSADEILQIHVWDWDTQWTREQLLEMIRDVDSRGDRFETRHRRKDGSFIDIEISSNGAVCAGQKLVFCVCRDISDRKRAEIAQRESEERFRQALENIPDVVVIYDADLRIRYINSATTRITGRPPADFIGKTEEEIWPPEVYQNYLPTLREVLERREQRSVDVVLTLQGGEPRYLGIACVPLLDGEGQVREILGITHDFTDHVKAEEDKTRLAAQLQQSQKMEAIGRLAGGVAHDFNNLLTAMRGNTALALEILSDGPAARHLHEIEEAGRRASEITAQLLAYSRRQVIEPRVLDLNAIVTDTGRMLGRLLGENIRIQRALAPDLWPVKADPSHLEQVLLNLAVNARDAMPGGGQLLLETRNLVLEEASAARHDDLPAGEYVALTASDTGAGMDEATLVHVFEPFFTTKAKGQGTGLGLSTVYGIVKQHGGSIKVRSQVGHGTAFEVLLPRAEGAPQSAPPAAPLGEIPAGCETLLLVEDDAGVAKIMRLLLAPLGYVLVTADSGEAALQVAADRAGPIHLLVTDVIMPGMNGQDLARRLSELRPEIRVLFVSGYTEDIIAKGGVLSADTHFLSKPYTRRSLGFKVRAVLDGTDHPEA